MSKEDDLSQELLLDWQEDGIGNRPPVRSHRKPTYTNKIILTGAVVAIASGVFVSGEMPQHTTVKAQADKHQTITQDLAAREIPKVTRAERPSPSAIVQAPAIKVSPPPPSWVAPLASYQTTSCFAMRNGRMHTGMDLAAPSGKTIMAVGAGKVYQAGWEYTGLGISIVVDHGGGWYTLYGHASKALVKAGQTVSPGQPIGLVGSTGHSTGPHVHFEVHKGMWNQQNPKPWMSSRGVNLSGCGK